MGVPTVFNILGPLTNPGRASTALVGCANATLAPVMANVLHERGVSAIVVRSEDGMDEIVTSGATAAWDATGTQVVAVRLTPEDFGLARVDPDLLLGGDRTRNAAVLRAVLSGTTPTGTEAEAITAVRDVVALNAAAAMAAYAAAGQTGSGPLVDRIAGHLPATQEAIAQGRALALLDRWAAITQRLRDA